MRILRALGLLAVYAAVVVWLTWPLAAGATTGIADGVASLDVLYSMWAMAWASVILPTAPAALADAPIYHPTPLAYFYGPSALGGVPLFAPVYWTTGNPVLMLTPPDPTVVRALAGTPGAVLELPVRDTSLGGPIRHARAMYHALHHGRPILNGYASYYPAAFPERMAVARRLPDAEALATLVRETGVTAIWVHLDALTPRRAGRMALAREHRSRGCHPAGAVRRRAGVRRRHLALTARPAGSYRKGP